MCGRAHVRTCAGVDAALIARISTGIYAGHAAHLLRATCFHHSIVHDQLSGRLTYAATAYLELQAVEVVNDCRHTTRSSSAAAYRTSVYSVHSVCISGPRLKYTPVRF